MPICNKCKKNFGTDDALSQHHVAVHADTDLGKINQKRPEKQETTLGGLRLWYGLSFIVVIGLVIGAYMISQPGTTITAAIIGEGLGSPPSGVVHWHPEVKMFVCGEERFLPKALPGSLIGTELLHLHDDGVFHIESIIPSWSEITLGRGMDTANIRFSETSFFEYNNGDTCPDGKEGEVSMTVNGFPSTQFGDYVFQEDSRIVITFD